MPFSWTPSFGRTTIPDKSADTPSEQNSTSRNGSRTGETKGLSERPSQLITRFFAEGPKALPVTDADCQLKKAKMLQGIENATKEEMHQEVEAIKLLLDPRDPRDRINENFITLQHVIDDYKNKVLLAMDHRNKTLSSQVAGLRKDLEQAGEEKKQLLEKIDLICSPALQFKLDDLKQSGKEKRALHEKIDLLNRTVLSRKNEIKVLQSKLDECSIDPVQSKKPIARAKICEGCTQKEINLMEAAKKITTLESSLDTVQRSLETMTQERDSHKKDIEFMESKANTSELDRQLKTQLVEALSRAEKLGAQVDELQDKLAEKRMKVEISPAKQPYTDEKSVKDLKEKMKKLKEENGKFRKQYAELHLKYSLEREHNQRSQMQIETPLTGTGGEDISMDQLTIITDMREQNQKLIEQLTVEAQNFRSLLEEKESQEVKYEMVIESLKKQIGDINEIGTK